MSRFRFVAVLPAFLTAAVIIGFGCKTTDQQSTRDATPEIAPVAAPVAPPPPPVDAAPDVVDAVADTGGAVPAKPLRKKPTPEGPPKAGKKGVSTMQVTGDLPKAAADEVLRGKAAAFATCHSAAGLHGQVQIKLTMNARGVVEIAKVMQSTLGGDETELCMARVAQRFKFPTSPGGGESTVTFQVKF